MGTPISDNIHICCHGEIPLRHAYFWLFRNTSKYVGVYQNADQNRDITIANRSFEKVSQFKYLGMTITNQNLIQEEINRRMNSGNDCYHSVQNLLSSLLLLKNVKVRIYKTIILPMVLYGCETWSVILRENTA
jgi:hypothetical protein